MLRAEAFAPHLPADSQDHFDPGLGVLVNLAAASARGELLAFVDEELAPTPDWVEAVERLFASAATDAVVGTTLLRPANAFAAAETGLEGAGGLALCIRRQAFMAAGGLDEYLCPQASAGAALVAALAARGVDVRASGEIVAYRPACRGVWEFARRLWLSGVGRYYGPRRLEVAGAGDRAWRRRALPRRIAAALAAPWRAAGIARGLAPRLAAPPLALLGIAARTAGTLWGCLRGGRGGERRASALLAEPSRLLVAPQLSAAMPVVSVIVPARQSHRCVKLCLAALLRQDVAEPYEVIVATPQAGAVAAELAEGFPQVRLCFCRPDAGPGGARNAGIRAARGEYLAFTDADCLPEADWLGNILAACRRNEGRPVRGWVQPGHRYSCVSRASDLAEKGTARPKRPHAVPGLIGANLCLAARGLAECQTPFAEGVYGAEEVALLGRVAGAKGQAVLTPAAQVREMRRDGLVGSLRRMYLLGRGSGQMRRAAPVRGSLFARHLWLVPLLGPARLLLTAARVTRCGWRAALDFLRLCPLVFCQLVWYSVGFAVGAGRGGPEGLAATSASREDCR